MQLVRDRAEVAHQQPGAERDEERRVGEDQRPARIEQAELEDHRRERDEEDGRRDEVGEEDRHADALRAAVAQPLDRVGGEHRREQREERRDHRDEHRVPEPGRVARVEEQLPDVGERRVRHPERAEALVVVQLVLAFEGRDAHPVKGEEQHEEEHAERQPERDRAGLPGLEVGHAAFVGGLVFRAHPGVIPLRRQVFTAKARRKRRTAKGVEAT